MNHLGDDGMDFSNDTVLITGASNGIGKYLAKAYTKHGASVIMADHDKGNGVKLQNELQDQGYQAYFHHCDVSDPEQISNLFENMDNNHSLPTILINNAGLSRFQDFFELTVEDWDDIMHSNLKSMFLCSQSIAKRWSENGIHGRIINMASTRAQMSEPNSEAYAASKGGIISLTHALAVTLSEYQIRVNCISPGWIQTEDYEKLRDIDHDQHPSKRVGHPVDIAKACFYLSDKYNAFVNGENLVIDGGMTRKMIYEH